MRHLRSLKLAALLGMAIVLVAFARPETYHASGNSDCKPDAPCTIVQGYSGNRALNDAAGATIAGGGQLNLPNLVTADFGTVGGGIDNISGNLATVAGGIGNRADGYRSTIAGGSGNIASSGYSTVAGGTGNSATNLHTTVGGGIDNSASALDATVAGGSGNSASYMLATVGGGAYNTASSLDATVAGGDTNVASGAFSTVAGGSGNRAAGFDTTVAGGSGNYATGDESAIGGGLANRATDKFNTVSGGYSNIAGNSNDSLTDAWYATVAGGSSNVASGAFSMVPGGLSNSAAAQYSFASGRRARVAAAHAGAILFADGSDADFASSAANEFAVRATGGVRLVTAIDPTGKPTSGVRLAPGGGAWEILSDRTAKMNVAPVDGQVVLAELASLPITTWSYKSQDASIRHIGPMAQDWSRLGFGEDPNYINSMDETGVALISVQALYQTVQKQDAELTALRAQNAAQQAQLAGLDQRVTDLENRMSSGGTNRGETANLVFIGLGFAGLVAAVARRP